MANANVVIRLSRAIPKHRNHRVYFDNYYTTIPLITYLVSQGIHSLGTVRRNRIPNCTFLAEKVINKKSRGTSYAYIVVYDNIPVTSVLWKDNKLVTLLSSYCGILPDKTICRFDKKERKNIEVSFSSIIKEYNKHMGGVDLLDSLIGRYKTIIHSKK
jgi:hypothetical protein